MNDDVFKNKELRYRNNALILKILAFIIIVIFLILFALNGRYDVDRIQVFDKWRGEFIKPRFEKGYY